MEGATSISTILLVDVDVGSFSSYKFIPTPWAKHTKTTVWGAPSLGNPSCSKLYFFSSFSRRRRRRHCRRRRWFVLKEPLQFSIFKPVAHSTFSESVLLFGKRSFVGLDSKYVFTYLHIYH